MISKVLTASQMSNVKGNYASEQLPKPKELFPLMNRNESRLSAVDLD